MRVQPRPTPAERPDTPVDVEVDEALSVLAAVIEDWVAGQPHWELILREAHLFGKANNVEAELLFVAGQETSALLFRLEQLDRPTSSRTSSRSSSRSKTASPRPRG